MKLTNFNLKKQQLLEWGLEVRYFLDESGDKKAVDEINHAIEQLKNNQITITLLGKAKRGKSTLINALLDRKDDTLAPVDKLPASSVISRFMYSETDKAIVYFRSGEQKEISFLDIKQYVTEEYNSENKKDVAFVDIFGQFENLKEGIILIDTPGTSSIHSHHDQIVYDIIPKSDIILFLCTAEMPIDQDELDLLKRIPVSDEKKVLFVVNKTDIVTNKELEEATSHNEKVLSEYTTFSDTKIKYKISALKAFESGCNKGNVKKLLSDIDLLVTESKERILSISFVNAVINASSDLLRRYSIEVKASETSREELEEKLQHLSEEKNKLSSDRKKEIRHFLSKWNKSVDEFEAMLPSKHEEIKVKFSQILSETSTFELNKFKKALPEFLKDLVDSELRETSFDLERHLRETLIDFQKDLPQLNIEAYYSTVSIESDNKLLAAAVGGTVTAALGTSLAIVASGASATAVTTTSLVGGGIGTTAATALGAKIGGYFAGAKGVVAGTNIAAQLFAPGAVATTVSNPVLWATVLGPVGWTIAGVGILAIPTSWYISKQKDRKRIIESGENFLVQVQDYLRKERIPDIRKMANYIVDEIEIKQEAQLKQIEDNIAAFIKESPNQKQIENLRNKLRDLELVLSKQEALFT